MIDNLLNVEKKAYLCSKGEYLNTNGNATVTMRVPFMQIFSVLMHALKFKRSSEVFTKGLNEILAEEMNNLFGAMKMIQIKILLER